MTYDDKSVVLVGQYPSIYDPIHPRANKSGMVYVHVLVAEEKLGRRLSDDECVHHVNGNKCDFSEANIWVFKTKNDHSRYHMALDSGMNYVLLYNDGVYSCLIVYEAIHDEIVDFFNKSSVTINPKTICPLCGGVKSVQSIRCNNCYDRTRGLNIPEDTLRDMLANMSYVAVAKHYGVTDTAIRKIAKKYGINKQCYPVAPDGKELMQLLRKYTRRAVAEHYGVSSGTVLSWQKQHEIHVFGQHEVVCIETGELFDTKSEAARCKYPDVSVGYARTMIGKSCKTGNIFGTFHWRTANDN